MMSGMIDKPWWIEFVLNVHFSHLTGIVNRYYGAHPKASGRMATRGEQDR
jgi:hypothetical protein